MKTNSDMVGKRTPGSAYGIATLDVNTKVVQDPANATATPTGSKIPISQSSQYLDPGWLNILQTELSDKNGGVITLLSGGADIITLDLGTVTAGQRWFVAAQIQDGEKGATAGRVILTVIKSSGTATIEFLHDLSSLHQSSYFDASDSVVRLSVNGIMKITGSGTLVLKTNGVSAGSNTTLAAGEGQLYAALIKEA